MTVMQSMKLGIDVNRHKEIIVKAVSAILLLLLKHFKARTKGMIALQPSFYPFSPPGQSYLPV